MFDLQVALEKFTNDVENPEKNYDLALCYDSIGQTAAAITYYLRAAERTNINELAYECLIRIGNCFNLQQNRANTVEKTFKQAINLLPKRPEAYLCLARFYEWNKRYVDCYTLCDIALSLCDFNLPTLRTNVHTPINFPKYGIIFEKAVSAWWWGKNQESRELFQKLINEHRHEIDKVHLECIRDNVSKIGAGPESQVFVYYNKKEHSNLRYKFKGSENIERNYSQVFQDMFILSMLDGKRNGTYLEIGSAGPFLGNNTALLEKDFGWKGIGIEYNESFIADYKANRSNKIICANALEVNYESLIREITLGNTIDYLQLDCEPSDTTYEILRKIPFDKFKFAVITYEHDDYVDITKTYKEKSRAFLELKGYKLVVSDVSCDGKSNFEDWWVHPDLVDASILNAMKDTSNQIKKVDNYFYNRLPVKEEISKTFNLNISYKSNKRIFVVDNFYEDPHSVREYALAQDFDQGGIGRGYIGCRTFKQFLFPGLKEKFEEILGTKIVRWEEHGMNGRFQYSIAGEPLVYHCDDQRWAGMLYLTPDAPFESGTTMWAHKRTKIRHNSHPQIMSTFRQESTLDKTPYEPVDVIGNVFNRLVIFDAGCIHSASEYFGFNQDNGRLWHMFFFD